MPDIARADEASLDRALRDAATVLNGAGIPGGVGETELLAAHVLGVSRGEVVRRRVLGASLASPDAQRFLTLVARRAERVPLQHLTGIAHFRTLDLDVGPGVFVPRPETEVSVGLAVAALVAFAEPGQTLRLVDLCSGSGVIALSVVTEAVLAGIDVTAVAVEVSSEAALWARRNVERLGAGRVELRVQGVAGCCPDLDGLVDVVTANPPYIPDGAVPRDPEVRDHDPALALYGGPDGMDVVREVAVAASRLCRPGATVIVEHGELQGPAVASVLVEAGFGEARTHYDLTGRPRVTTARSGSAPENPSGHLSN